MFGYSFRRIILFLSVAAWIFGRWCLMPMRASAEAPPKADVTLSRVLWASTMKRLISLEAEVKNKEALLRERDAIIKEKDATIQIERNACASRLASERLRHAQQVKAIRKCAEPIACYVGLGICGALVIGSGVGGYYIGRGSK